MGLLVEKALENDIEVAYLQGLIRKHRMLPSPQAMGIENWPWRVKVYTLGRFGLVVDDQPFSGVGKAQSKPQILLKTLIALGGRSVSERQLIENLWEETDGDAASQAYRTTLHRLRNLIGQECLQVQDGRLTLDLRFCWVDVFAFERLANSLGRENHRNGAIQGRAEKVFKLYQGTFLPDSDSPGILFMRERLQSKFHRWIRDFGNLLYKNGDYEQAAAVYEKALEINHLSEEFYRNLIRCHVIQGYRAEALRTYERFLRVFSAAGFEPSAETEAIYLEIQSGENTLSPFLKGGGS
jgi:two-component SAPR family response regulator